MRTWHLTCSASPVINAHGKHLGNIRFYSLHLQGTEAEGRLALAPVQGLLSLSVTLASFPLESLVELESKSLRMESEFWPLILFPLTME